MPQPWNMSRQVSTSSPHHESQDCEDQRQPTLDLWHSNRSKALIEWIHKHTCILMLLNATEMKNSCESHWWRWRQHQQTDSCSGTQGMFGKYINELWMMQILCSKHGRLWNDCDAATCQNLDIACDTCNFWSCDSCATLYNLPQVPKSFL